MPFGFGSKRNVASSVIDMQKIISPVSQYINANPVPPTVKHIRPKVSKFLDSEIDEALSEETKPSPAGASSPKKKIFPPLPAAQYCSSKLSVVIPVAPDDIPKELPKAFGVVNSVQGTVSLYGLQFL